MIFTEYKTRADSSPSGKPKVLVYAAAQDLDRYLGRITEDLLSRQNCAVYFDREMADVNGYLESVRFVNLLVTVVTEAFLDGFGGVCGQVYRAAAESGVPVLPILTDVSLAERFNACCEDRQSLLLDENDPTSLGYDRKLTDYLERVLIGSEPAEEAARAFDASVFLSYRKKDRSEALRLMKLIHSSPDTLGVGIWYDEFLNLGRSFNENIDRELSSCDLFALCVTPSILEEGNYVLNVELPNARKYSRQMLCAEMAPTDRSALEAAGITGIISGDDEKALAAALTSALGGRLKARSSDPVRLYYLGLAYLAGIRTEIDGGKAEQLLISSAEGGCPEAAGKLSDMYLEGQGVKRDLEKSLYWNGRNAVMLGTLLGKAGDNEQLLEISRGLFFCGQRYTLLHDHQNAAEVYRVILSALPQEFEAGGLVERFMLRAVYELGRALTALGDSKSSEEMLLYAVQNFRPSPDNAHWLTNCYFALGDICLGRGDYAKAIEYYKCDRAITSVMIAVTDPENARQNLPVIDSRLGEAHFRAGEFGEAREYVLRDLEQYGKIAEEYRTDAHRRNLIGAELRLGELDMLLGDTDGAVERISAAFNEAQLLAEKTDQPDDIRLYGAAALKLSDAYLAVNRPDDAAGLLDITVAADSMLYEKYGDRGTVNDYAIALYKRGQLYIDAGDEGSAEEMFRKAAELYSRLGDEDPATAVQRYECERLLMEFSLKRRAYRDACEHGEALLGFVRSAFNARQTAQTYQFLLYTLNRLSSLYECCGRLGDAESAANEATELIRRNIDRFGPDRNTANSLDRLVSVNCTCALELMESSDPGKLGKAAELLQGALDAEAGFGRINISPSDAAAERLANAVRVYNSGTIRNAILAAERSGGMLSAYEDLALKAIQAGMYGFAAKVCIDVADGFGSIGRTQAQHRYLSLAAEQCRRSELYRDLYTVDKTHVRALDKLMVLYDGVGDEAAAESTASEYADKAVKIFQSFGSPEDAGRAADAFDALSSFKRRRSDLEGMTDCLESAAEYGEILLSGAPASLLPKFRQRQLQRHTELVTAYYTAAAKLAPGEKRSGCIRRALEICGQHTADSQPELQFFTEYRKQLLALAGQQ
ncbi:MAG: hypothetical protein IKP47_02860 [Ruminococcus sp.]|nr:hypothetical protein [Ruminococcus sp.]